MTRESSELKKNHILPSKLGHIPDGVSHCAELSWEGGFRAESKGMAAQLAAAGAP